jgi:Ca2+/Na+ antiporter
MFSTKSLRLFALSALLITLAYLAMGFDPAKNGFGVLTLWIAPPLLLIGFFLPLIAIIGTEHFGQLKSKSHQAHTWRNAGALTVFVLALVMYLITLEPTASLWDCSEFIAAAYKLQVPHTPGTPLSLLFGRLFAMLAMDAKQVAFMINAMSAFFSAATVVLVYRIIYFFGENLFSQPDVKQRSMLIMASLCGSLCLAYTDTFWFNAVEAETYGIACFFLLLLFWLMLKTNTCDASLRPRLLILIAYLSGLAYCIHPMCLLALPALPFLWITRGRNLRLHQILLLLVCGLVLVFAINRIVAIGLFTTTFTFDRIAVNTFHLPFYSGAFIFLLVLIIVFYFLFRQFSQHKVYTWAVIFLLLGFLPYLMLFIRSNHNPPIDETNPEDLYQIKAYMNRESYPTSPLLYGPYFDARIEHVTIKHKAYVKDTTSYTVAGNLANYEFEKVRQTILPRLYSRDENHIQAYRKWLGLKATEKPNFTHNLKFMFSYQLGHMYWRYLLWNFAGRAGDEQDSDWLRPWDSLSDGKFERARNQYWMIPLLLGCIGAWIQFKKDKKGFTANLTLFLCTGLVLALYLNSPPIEPRERDYIYVASYIGFAIWIGLGILSVMQLCSKYRIASIMSMGIGVLLPVWMAYQNFDDHNRAGRTFQMDHARSVLNSCAPGAVLFTGGDNDTFPLWYLQEVEGYRTDVRVVVLSYFNTDWYINQLRKPYYDSEALQLSLATKDYQQYGPNDVLYLEDKIKTGIYVDEYLKLIHAEHPGIKRMGYLDEAYTMLPSRLLKIKMPDPTTPPLVIKVNGNYLEKNALAILDLIVSNGWKRPLYFNMTSINGLGMDIEPYLQQEGLIYKLTSTRNDSGVTVNTSLTYKNLIERTYYANLADDRINFNYEDYHARMIVPLRQALNTLAEAYYVEGNPEKAAEVIYFSLGKLYHPHLLPSYTQLYTAEILIQLGNHALAKQLISDTFNFYYTQVQSKLDDQQKITRLDQYMLRQSSVLLLSLGDSSYQKKLEQVLP